MNSPADKVEREEAGGSRDHPAPCQPWAGAPQERLGYIIHTFQMDLPGLDPLVLSPEGLLKRFKT